MLIFREIFHYVNVFYLTGLVIFIFLLALHKPYYIRKFFFASVKKIRHFIISWKFLLQLIRWRFDDSHFMLKIFDHTYEKGYRSLNFFFIKYVFICKPDHIEKLLKDQENINKSELYVGFKDWLGDSVLMRNGEDYTERMKILLSCFHLRILHSFMPSIEKNARKLVQTIKDNRDEVFILPLAKKCTFNIVYETFLGIEENSALMINNSSHAKLLLATSYPVVNRAANFFLSFDTIFYLTRNGKKFRENKTILREITKEIIREKLNQTQENINSNPTYDDKKRSSFLDILLHLVKKNKDMTIESFYEDIELLLFAGFDTVALTVSWSLYLLSQHPDIQKTVKEELNNIFRNDINRSIRIEDLHEMKYLECVIKESLRMFPPVPFISRKASKSLLFGNKIFSKNWTFIVSIFHLHRNPYIFKNPEEFIPDRFLPGNAMHPYAFIPFSAGPRMCLGYRLAMMEIKIILACILRNSTIECIDKSINLFFRSSLNPRHPYRLRFKFEDE